jgi:hypothetical protein
MEYSEPGPARNVVVGRSVPTPFLIRSQTSQNQKPKLLPRLTKEYPFCGQRIKFLFSGDVLPTPCASSDTPVGGGSVLSLQGRLD